jgi:hypothetical protein
MEWNVVIRVILYPCPRSTVYSTFLAEQARDLIIGNRLGTKVLPKLRTGNDLRVDVDLSVSLNTELVRSMVSDLRQILQDLALEDRLRIEQDEGV